MRVLVGDHGRIDSSDAIPQLATPPALKKRGNHSAGEMLPRAVSVQGACVMPGLCDPLILIRFCDFGDSEFLIVPRGFLLSGVARTATTGYLLPLFFLCMTKVS